MTSASPRPRPPADITPAGFFSTWLPAELARLPGKPTATFTVRVALDGEGGGAWDLKVSPAGVAVTEADQAAVDVTLAQSVADWRAVVVGEPGAVELAPPQASPLDLMLLDGQAQAMLQLVKGTLRFEVTGFNDRTWSIHVKLGPQPMASPADATISVDAVTYAGMLARTIPPAQAFFSGQIRLSGDTALAMQLGMAMMPRLG